MTTGNPCVMELVEKSLPDLSFPTKEDPVIFSNDSKCAGCHRKIKDHDLIQAYKCSKGSDEKEWKDLIK